MCSIKSGEMQIIKGIIKDVNVMVEDGKGAIVAPGKF